VYRTQAWFCAACSMFRVQFAEKYQDEKSLSTGIRQWPTWLCGPFSHHKPLAAAPRSRSTGGGRKSRPATHREASAGRSSVCPRSTNTALAVKQAKAKLPLPWRLEWLKKLHALIVGYRSMSLGIFPTTKERLAPNAGRRDENTL